MSIKKRIIFLCLNVIFVGCINANEGHQNPLSQICENASWCDKVAQEKKWTQQSATTNSKTISNLTFQLAFPENFSEIVVLWGELPVYTVKYTERNISVSMEGFPKSKTEIKNDIGASQNNLAPEKIFDIMFNKKIVDFSASGGVDISTWKVAFELKKRQFENVEQIYKLHKEQWTAYLLREEGGNNEARAIILHESVPGRYMVVKDTSKNLDYLQAIVSTVSLVK